VVGLKISGIGQARVEEIKFEPHDLSNVFEGASAGMIVEEGGRD